MNPYQNLPDNAFWKLAVANKSMFDLDNVWDPKFNIQPEHKFVTFGSCFAQHIGKALIDRNFSWISTEKPPVGLSQENCKKFNYNVFSCRTGNIYTTSLLKQWVEWSLNIKPVPKEYWEKEQRFYDPFRPGIEPDGFSSIAEMRQSQRRAIACFKMAIQTSNFFVFTLGLTESWFNKSHGYEYPMCPGTVAGVFNKQEHIFKNQQFDFILANLASAIEMMLGVNKNLKIILTVSPVPLTATNSGKHVLMATMESKSILRAVAGQLATNRPYIDYFPSYELINSPPFRGSFFEPNLRSVNPHGVDFVMNSFFKCLENKFGEIVVKKVEQKVEQKPRAPLKVNHNDVICEEELLAGFGKAVI